MKFYADLPARRARQVAGDALVAAWVVVCVLLGRSVHDLLASAAEPLRSAAQVGSGIEDGMGDAGRGAGRVPLLGEQLSRPFEAVASAGGQLRDAGVAGAERVEALAVLVGILLALLLALLVVLPWLGTRLRYAARAGGVRRLQDEPGGADLLALRALTLRPERSLAVVGPAAAAAWRAGDDATTAALAALETERWGVAARGGDRRAGAEA
ncbi:hypothetical protein ATJ97_1083 [Georgenia soli]|uniref:Uncharacterized protein n=1 Tax=Georgenia soli TaxID=638953 RepID=A0A2A9EK49_9MICO|nr:hypothetical protein [Georgenia soli]PFG38599.1 hypothetical protein ATJ97_1083 [Georgenia soli]